ncbi:MAG: preprotein translocase subunit YajC [Candidatus Bipolaricaulota bacterium]|nr:MAG: preprotein translocase subunit YajC [Candidatus Bipolaricaulota bacterium]
MRTIVVLVGLLLVLGVGFVAGAQEVPSSQPAAEPTSQIGTLVAILVVFGVVFYFMLIRPQRKRQARHNQLIQELKRGDRVVTAGGIHGEIDSIGESEIVVAVEDGTKIRFSKNSIVQKVAR